MEDVYDVPGLYCTLCKHDLNHRAYKICQHPVLEVPVCLLCEEQVREVFENAEDLTELCSWCGEGGELLGCSNTLEDGEECEHFFCRDCIAENLGKEHLESVEDTDAWSCLVCDPTQLTLFRKALKHGEDQSIFNEALDECKDATEEQLAIARLEEMVGETRTAVRMLDSEHFEEKRREVATAFELGEISKDAGCCSSVEEELELYQQYWQRHYDITLRQEADLCEQVSLYGYSLSELPCYQQSDDPTTAAMSEEEYTRVDREVLQQSKAATAAAVAAKAEVKREVPYVEEVEEVDSEGRLESLRDLAAADATVAKYASRPTVEAFRYPPSFEAVQPVGVLKVLYYGSLRSAEVQELIAKFGVAPHIALVMSVASNAPRGFTDHWTIASRVHPSVRKALYELSAPLDLAILCSHYQLGEEYCSVTDFGDAEDICRIYTETRQGVNPHADEVNPKTLNELAELEGEGPAAQSSLVAGRTSAVASNANGSSKKRVPVVPLAALEQQQQQQVVIESHEAEDEDEIRLHRQRVTQRAGVKFDRCDEQLEEKHEVVKHRTKHALQTPATAASEKEEGTSSGAKALSTVGSDSTAAKKTRGAKGARRSSSRSSRLKRFLRGVAPQAKTGVAVSSGSRGGRRLSNTVLRVVDSDQYSSSGEESSSSSSSSEQRRAAKSSGAEEWDSTAERREVKEPRRRSKGSYSTLLDSSDFEVVESEEEETVAEGSEGSGYWEPSVMEEEEEPTEVKAEPDLQLSLSPIKGVSASQASSERMKRPKYTPEVVDLTLSGDEGKDDNSSGSHSSPSGSDVIGVGADASDSDEGSEFSWKLRAKKRRRSVLKKVKKASLSDDEDEEEDDDSVAEVPATRAKSSSGGSSGAKKAGMSVWLSDGRKSSSTKPSSKPSVKPELPASLTAGSQSNTYDVGKALDTFSLFKKRPSRIKLSSEELLSSHFLESDETSFALNPSRSNHQEPVLVPSEMVARLKDHQREGLQFMWANVLDASYKQLNAKATKKDSTGRSKDHGCLLAHCMGLGKTLQIVTFTTTLLSNPHITSIIDPYQPEEEDAAKAVVKSVTASNSAASLTDLTATSPGKAEVAVVRAKKQLVKCVLIIVPLITVENWMIEYGKWTPEDLKPFVNATFIDSSMLLKARIEALRRWHSEGGVMVMGYDMFRNLTKATQAKPTTPADGGSAAAAAPGASAPVLNSKKKAKPSYSEDVRTCRHFLIHPGPDLVVADEAHQLSNKDSKISIAFNEMRTKRRIALTGSPLQNNLVEYFIMVEWVKKGHLAPSLNRYRELFVEPINNGDKAGAHPYDVVQMRKKVFVLNKKLSSIVNRKDFSILTQSLKMKRQFVLCIKMTPFQQYLYRVFLVKVKAAFGKATLFKTYQTFLRLWNHPACTVIHALKEKEIQAAELEARNNPNKKGNKPKMPIFLSHITRELSVTVNHFKRHKDRLLAEMAAKSKDIESALLKNNTLTEGFEVDDERGDEDAYEASSVSGDRKRPRSSLSLDEEAEEGGAGGANEVTPDGKRARGIAEGDGLMDVDDLDTSTTSRLPPSLTQGLTQGGGRPPLPYAAPAYGDAALVDWWKYVPRKGADSTTSSPSKPPSAPSNDDVVDLTSDDDEERPPVGPEEEEDDPSTFSAQLPDLELMQLSNKLVTFLSLLVLSVQAGDKVLMFSQSLYTLNMVELFLRTKNWGDIVDAGKAADGSLADRREQGRFSNWIQDREYMRIDGSTKERQKIIDKFNSDGRFKLCMVCTKAGNMGINLYSANRVIIFDSSWNPVHDLQAISRSYRYGQQKEVFVYRMVAAGSMEETIYKRQMIKQALAARVVDAQMPDNQAAGGELMDFTEANDREGDDSQSNGNGSSSSGKVQLSDTVNHDPVLLKYVDKHSALLSYIADQEVLLEDKVDSHLTEDQQKAAEAEYEKETALDNRPPVPLGASNEYPNTDRARDYMNAYNKAMVDLEGKELLGHPIEDVAKIVAARWVEKEAETRRQATLAARTAAINEQLGLAGLNANSLPGVRAGNGVAGARADGGDVRVGADNGISDLRGLAAAMGSGWATSSAAQPPRSTTPNIPDRVPNHDFSID